MLRKLSFLSLLFISGMVMAQINNPAPYCETSHGFGNYNMFESITVNDNELNFGPEGNLGQQLEDEYYNKFTALITKGEEAQIELKSYSVNDGEPLYFALWIDFNQNDTFENEELIMQNSNTINAGLNAFDDPNQTIPFSYIVPADAVLGMTRARLMRGSDIEGDNFIYTPEYELNPCVMRGSEGYGYGHTYDFNVNITEATMGLNDTRIVENKVRLFPNPVHDFVNFSGLEEPTQYTVFNINGKQVLSGTTQAQINVNTLAKGVYFINFINKQKTVTKRIIKQ